MKAGEFNRFLIEVQTKNTEKDHFIKNLSPTVVKQSSSNFNCLLFTSF